jgi:hypothetical protein
MDVVAKYSVMLLILFVFLFMLFLKNMRVRYSRTKKLIATDYGFATGCCFLILGSIVGILGHIGWLVIILVATFVGLIVLLSFEAEKRRAITDAVEIEAIKKVDVSESIRFKDFFSGYGLILKLNRKFGTRKAMVIHTIIFTCFVVVLLFLMFFLMDKLIFANERWWRGSWMLYSSMWGPLLASVFLNYNFQKKTLKKAETLSLAQSSNSFTPASNTQSPQPSNDYAVSVCANCGTIAAASNAIFCTNCGKQIRLK